MNGEKSVQFLKENFFTITFVFVIFLFFWKFVILQEAFLKGDYSAQHAPWAKFLADSLNSFSFPLWAPYMHSGFPVLAEGQIGAMYPPNLFLYFLLPFKAAYTYNILLHFVLAGIFMYIYVREIGMSKTAATITVIAFLFGSAYGGCFYSIMSLKVLVWFPLILFFTEKLFKKEELLYGILIGVVIGVQILAGYLQFALYSIIFSTLYFVVHLYFYHLKDRGFKKSTRIAFFYFIGACVAFGLSAAQLFATVELIQFSSRQDLGIDFSMSGSYIPLGLIQLFFPRCTNFTGEQLYIGVLPFFMSLIIIFHKKDRFSKFFIFLAIFSLFLAFGKYSPLYVGIIKAIGFYGLRVPSKFLYFTAFSLAVLAGYGFDKYFSTEYGERKNTRFKKTILYISLGAAVILMLANVVLHYGKVFFINFGKNYVEENVYEHSFHRHALDDYYEKVDSIFEMLVSNTYIFDKYNISSIVIIVLSIIIVMYMKNRVSPWGLKVTCLIIVVLDLFIFSFFGTGFRGNMAPTTESLKAPESIEFIKKDTDIYRVYSYIPTGSSDDISRYLPNYNMLFNVSDVGAYSPLVINSYYKLIGNLGCVDDSIGRMEPSLDSLSRNLNLLSLLNVKYILSGEDIPDSRLELAFNDGSMKVYRNKAFLPRSFFLTDYRVISEKEEALAFMKSEEFCPEDIVVLNEEPVGLEKKSDNIHGKAIVDIKEYQPGKVILNVAVPSNGILVLSDLFYPGWEAFVDGEEVKILRADYILRAIYMPEGKHLVKFEYNPKPFNSGVKLSLCTLISIPFLIFVAAYQGTRK